MVVPERCQRASPAKHEPPRARQPGQEISFEKSTETRPHAMKLIVSSDGVTPEAKASRQSLTSDPTPPPHRRSG